jgi:hypothetical protein
MEREDEIRIIAYQIWEEEDCCHGKHVEHWLKAETIWQERNKAVRTMPETQPSVTNQQINTAVKTKPSALLSTHPGKKGKSSKGEP